MLEQVEVAEVAEVEEVGDVDAVGDVDRVEAVQVEVGERRGERAQRRPERHGLEGGQLVPQQRELVEEVGVVDRVEAAQVDAAAAAAERGERGAAGERHDERAREREVVHVRQLEVEQRRHVAATVVLGEEVVEAGQRQQRGDGAADGGERGAAEGEGGEAEALPAVEGGQAKVAF